MLSFSKTATVFCYMDEPSTYFVVSPLNILPVNPHSMREVLVVVFFADEETETQTY